MATREEAAQAPLYAFDAAGFSSFCDRFVKPLYPEAAGFLIAVADQPDKEKAAADIRRILSGEPSEIWPQHLQNLARTSDKVISRRKLFRHVVRQIGTVADGHVFATSTAAGLVAGTFVVDTVGARQFHHGKITAFQE